ncbi:hypothetical protein NP568_24350, partial [Vibrio parahaemolyticus]|nr:hypothetical protein [Vibrio parahaemolyticus]
GRGAGVKDKSARGPHRSEHRQILARSIENKEKTHKDQQNKNNTRIKTTQKANKNKKAINNNHRPTNKNNQPTKTKKH